MMYTEDEKKYLNLSAKLTAELQAINDQIYELEARRDRLAAILNGEAPDQLEERLNDLGPVEDKYVAGGTATDYRDHVDKNVSSFIKKNPGSSRSDIANNLKTIDVVELGRSLNRLRSRNLIISEGRSRAALWYPTET